MKRLTITHINRLGAPIFPSLRDVSFLNDYSTPANVRGKVAEFEALYKDRRVIDVNVDRVRDERVVDPAASYTVIREATDGDGK